MELKQYANLLWRWAWLILIAMVLPAGATYVSGRMETPVYQASTTFFIDQAPDARYTDYSSMIFSELLSDTYVQLMTKRPVLEEVAARLSLNMDLGSLKGAIQVSPVQGTKIIEVKATHTDPTLAAEIANALVTVFSEQNAELQASRFAASKENLSAQLTRIEEQIQLTEAAIGDMGSLRTENGKTEFDRLQNELTQLKMSYTTLLQSYEGLRLAEALSVSNLIQVEEAIPPKSPLQSNIMRDSMLAGVVGAMLAVGLVFLIDYLDDTLKSTEESSQALGLPVIGFVAKANSQTEGVPIAAREPRSPITEAFRSLRSNIQFSSVDDPIKTILIVSPSPKEGKSTVAANLAVVMANEGKRVILLDADLRKPSLHRIMGVPNRLGLSDFNVRPASEMGNIIRRLEYDNLYILTSGKLPPNPAELLGSERMSQIINMLRGKFDYVIIDSPPMGVVTDPTILSAIADAVILVVEPKKTRMVAAMQAVEQLRRAGANLIGMVYNNVPLKNAGYYTGYYYQYAYSYVDGENGKEPQRMKKRRLSKREKA